MSDNTQKPANPVAQLCKNCPALKQLLAATRDRKAAPIDREHARQSVKQLADTLKVPPAELSDGWVQ
jgi:hypothetical protein